MHVIVVSEVIPPVAPNALQASVCDEQLVSIGGEIASCRETLNVQGFKKNKECCGPIPSGARSRRGQFIAVIGRRFCRVRVVSFLCEITVEDSLVKGLSGARCVDVRSWVTVCGLIEAFSLRVACVCSLFSLCLSRNVPQKVFFLLTTHILSAT